MKKSISRRKILQGISGLGVIATLPAFAAWSEFPAQSVIDDDPLRPRYHLMPRRGWMNDPCAPVFYRGRYHLFFQYNPGASVWGDMHWAHAVSSDMVHWRARPLALAPTPGGADAFGVFTGSMVFAGKTPTILYTCVSPSSRELSTLYGSDPPEREAQCLATPSGERSKNPDAALDLWRKAPQPVIEAPPAGMKVTGFRDPVPWREADGSYYLLVASGEKDRGGNVLLYKSADLHSWSFQHVFAQGNTTGKQTSDTVDSGEMWECPDFFPLGDKHILIHSTGTIDGRKTMWQSGTLDKRTMQWTPEQEGVLNHGPYYAPKTQLDATGHRILWGWINETRPEAEFARAGWAGCMSLPRVLTLKQGILHFSPARGTSGLRASISSGSPQTRDNQCEVVIQVERSPKLSAKPFTCGALAIEAGSAPADDSLLWNGEEIIRGIALPASFSIRCFIDHSVVEVFVADQVVLTHRFYGTEQGRLRLPYGFVLKDTQVYPLRTVHL